MALVAVITAVGLAGCRQRPATDSALESEKTTFTRIIPMAPNLVETVFALGAGDKVVAVTDFTIYPPEALDLPRIGGTFNANLEKITRLQPDLVIIQGEHDQVARLCQARGIRLLRVRMDSIATIRNGIRQIGAVLDRREAALQLVEEIDRDLAALAAGPGQPRRPVALVMGHTPGGLRGMTTFGPESFLTELVELAGGRNVVAGDGSAYPPLSLEALAARGPEVILEFRPAESLDDAQRARLLADWSALPGVPAAASGRIRFITAPELLIPGPRVADIVRRLAAAIHDEAGLD